MGLINTRDHRLLALGSGCDQDLVRGQFANQCGIDGRLEANLDAESADLRLEPIEQAFVRFVDERGKAQRATQLAGFLAEHDFVAAQSGETGGFEPRRTPANDQNALAGRG